MITSRLDNELSAFQKSQSLLEKNWTDRILTVQSNLPLRKYIDPKRLQEQLDAILEIDFSKAELDYLKNLKFSEPYLEFISKSKPRIKVLSKKDDIRVRVIGRSIELPLWEAPLSAQIYELYYRGIIDLENIDLDAVTIEGIRKFQTKADLIRNSGAKFIEAGSRYRYHSEWYSLLLQVILGDMPDNLIGTTNVASAMSFGLNPMAVDLRVSSSEFIDIENALQRSGKDQLVVRNCNAFQITHLYSHFCDRLMFEWDFDLTSDIGPLGERLSLTFETLDEGDLA